MKCCIAITCMLLATSLPSPYVQRSNVVSGSSLTLTVAPPAKAEMTRVPQFDNERATSWKSVIPPRTESSLHRHDRFRTIVGVVGGDLATVDAHGKKTVTHYETGKAYWQAPMPAGEMHRDVNETDKTIELIVVENK
jgi:L,D-peptidoglycan transpeptidase YkuD (ErfK/YbiS/YcfS/YnhG family)